MDDKLRSYRGNPSTAALGGGGLVGSSLSSRAFLLSGSDPALAPSFRSASYGGDVGRRYRNADEGIPSHTIRGVTWIDAGAFARAVGYNIDPREDIMAPAAAINLDSVRSFNGHNYISAPALAHRLRMNDRSRLFVIMMIRRFLESSVGSENVVSNVRFSNEICVDFYVPNARLTIDVNSGTLASSSSKVQELMRNGIYHIEVMTATNESTSRFEVGGALSENMDMKRFLEKTIPEIFMRLVADFKIGNHHESASVDQYMRIHSSREQQQQPYSSRRSTKRMSTYRSPDRIYRKRRLPSILPAY